MLIRQLLLDLAVDLVLDNGKLTLTQLDTAMHGGTVKVSGVVDAGQDKPAIALQVTARQVEAGTLSQTLGITRVLSGGKVDLDLEVTETNAEWGYMLFVYKSSESGSRANRGSFTFVRDEDEVHVSLQIPEMPSYHEQMLVDQLRRKLEVEHGEPPPRKKPPKKPAKPKHDDDDDEDEDKPKDEGEPKKPDDTPKED